MMKPIKSTMHEEEDEDCCVCSIKLSKHFFETSVKAMLHHALTFFWNTHWNILLQVEMVRWCVLRSYHPHHWVVPTDPPIPAPQCSRPRPAAPGEPRGCILPVRRLRSWKSHHIVGPPMDHHQFLSLQLRHGMVPWMLHQTCRIFPWMECREEMEWMWDMEDIQFLPQPMHREHLWQCMHQSCCHYRLCHRYHPAMPRSLRPPQSHK